MYTLLCILIGKPANDSACALAPAIYFMAITRRHAAVYALDPGPNVVGLDRLTTRVNLIFRFVMDTPLHVNLIYVYYYILPKTVRSILS
jgi:hypothetical protein